MARITARTVAPPRRARRAAPPAAAVVEEPTPVVAPVTDDVTTEAPAEAPVTTDPRLTAEPTPSPEPTPEPEPVPVDLTVLPTVIVEDKNYYNLGLILEHPELQKLFKTTVPGGEQILRDYAELVSLPTFTQDGESYYDLAKILRDTLLKEVFERRISGGTEIIARYRKQQARKTRAHDIPLPEETLAQITTIEQEMVTLRPQYITLRDQWSDYRLQAIRMFDPSANWVFDNKGNVIGITTNNIELYNRIFKYQLFNGNQVGTVDQDGNVVSVTPHPSIFTSKEDGTPTDAYQTMLDDPLLMEQYRQLIKQSEFSANQMHQVNNYIVGLQNTITNLRENRYWNADKNIWEIIEPGMFATDEEYIRATEQLRKGNDAQLETLIEVLEDVQNFSYQGLAEHITAEGNFDLPGAIKADIPESVLKAIGYTDENIKRANALNDILAILPDGITGYDSINIAIQSGLEDQLGILGITEEQIFNAQAMQRLILEGFYSPDTGAIDLLGAIEAGMPSTYLFAIGLSEEDYNEAVAFFAANTAIGGGGWISKTDAEAIKDATPDLYEILISQGHEAYGTAFEQTHTQVGDDSYISSVELEKVRQDSEELYEILLNQGFDAYSAKIVELNAERQVFLDTHQEVSSDVWFLNSDLTAIEKESPQLYTILIEQGYDAYTKEMDRLEAEYQARLIILRDLEEYRIIEGGRPAEAQPVVYDLSAAVAGGFDLDVLREMFPAETVAQAVATADATKLLAPYRNPDGTYNVTVFNTDHPGQLEQLASLGFIPANSITELNKLVSGGTMTQSQRGVLSQAIRRASLGSLQEYLVDIVSADVDVPLGTRQKEWDELTDEQKRVVAANYYTTDLGAWKPLSEALKDVGIMMTPVYGTIYFWNEMDTAGRTLSVLMDIAVIALPFMRGIAGTMGRILAPLSKQSSFFKTASAAGRAYRELQVALKNLRKIPLASKGYVKAASRVQKLVQASVRADRVFLEKLSYIERLSVGELRALEKLSGFKGLKQIVIDIGKAHKRLEAVWKQLDRYPLGSPSYIRNLPKLEQARARLTKVLNQFEAVAKPRYRQSPHAGWQKVMSRLEKELELARKNHSRARSSGDPNQLRDAQDLLTVAEINLAEAQRLMKIGTLPATLRTRLTFRETIDAQGLLDELDLYNRGIGRYRPPEPRVTTRGRVPVVVKEKLVVPHKIKVTVKTKLAEVLPELKPKAPKVAPRVKTSVFPGIKPAIKISSATREDTIPIEAWGRMTLDQIRRLYGEQVMVRAVGVPLSVSKRLPRGWVSPAEAIKAGNLVASWVSTQFAPAIALRPVTLAAVAPTIGLVAKPAVDVLPGVRTLVDVAPLTSTIPAVAVATLVGVTPAAPAKVPVTPKTPVIGVPLVIPLPVLTRLQTQSSTSQEIPAGSIAWAQGQRKGQSGRMIHQWYFIPPPYDQDKPISLSAPPIGARKTDSNSPYDTIQIIGRSKGIPKKVSIDLGWADIFIINGKTIEFKSGGEKTDVGTRLPSLTRGMSVDEGVEPFVSTLVSKGVSRLDISKKRPKRKGRKKKRLTAYEYMTTLKGFVP